MPPKVAGVEGEAQAASSTNAEHQTQGGVQHEPPVVQADPEGGAAANAGAHLGVDPGGGEGLPLPGLPVGTVLAVDAGQGLVA
ncbi:hypothetical protein, partial [Thioalkalivibrio sp. ALR17-21]|uniref:hypothetical protein n=1 Tax=Thioalkalivibrio sp. ALR17-21 TaxID=1269813 RepID=UPI0004A39E96